MPIEQIANTQQARMRFIRLQSEIIQTATTASRLAASLREASSVPGGAGVMQDWADALVKKMDEATEIVCNAVKYS